MNFRQLVEQNRTCRRFKESEPVSMDVLEDLVDLARLTPSGGNLQPLKYVLSASNEMNQTIFDNLAWAAYLKDWSGPEPGERPAAYIIIMGDGDIAKNIDCDHGIAAQTMLLGAVEKGLAGCTFASIKREKLAKALDLPENLRIMLILALGAPVEERVVYPVADDDDIKYWRDGKGVHHVPKRSLSEIITARYF